MPHISDTLVNDAQKIKIALREKGLAFDVEVLESLGTGRTDNPFGTGDPRAEVPLLVCGPTRIFESTIILENIEERWPDPPLLPRSPEARATARITEDVCDTHYEAVTWGLSEVMTFGRATGPLRAAAARQLALDRFNSPIYSPLVTCRFKQIARRNRQSSLSLLFCSQRRPVLWCIGSALQATA